MLAARSNEAPLGGCHAAGMTVRVRFAPAPTGDLHEGGAMVVVANHLLRTKLGGAGDMIETVRGFGYRFRAAMPRGA